MFRERGIVIHAEDCLTDYWADRLTGEGLHLNVVGVHPAGGHDAHQTMDKAVHMLSTPEWAKFASRMEKAGIAIIHHSVTIFFYNTTCNLHFLRMLSKPLQNLIAVIFFVCVMHGGLCDASITGSQHSTHRKTSFN